MKASTAIVPIVEGHGEIDAVPVILRRFLAERGAHGVAVHRPFRVKRHAVIRPGELERAIRAALTLREAPGRVSIVLIVDADDDCPVQLAASLTARAEATTDRPVAVVVACRESEAWILADIDHISRSLSWPLRSRSPTSPEALRGAKEWLRENLGSPTPYKPTEHQAKLFARIRLEEARSRAPSLDKLLREVSKLVASS